jgi:hypothetical protein
VEDPDSEEDEGPVKEGKVPVGGIKAPAKMKQKALLKLVPKLEAQIVKLKETIKKSRHGKDCVGEVDGEDGKPYKELYQTMKSDYDVERQKRVDCEDGNKRLQGDNRNLELQIETSKNDKVTLIHDKKMLDKEITHIGEKLTKAEKEVEYFKAICYPPQPSQRPSTSTLGGPFISQTGFSPVNVASNGFISPP